MTRSDVFISYRRANVEFVKELDQALRATGREVWVDWEDIPPGVEGFADEIVRGIDSADALIAVLSPEYMESEYCLMELKHGLTQNKRIIPIVLKKFDGAPPEGIGHINWVYFCPHAGQENPFDEAFAKVVHALETDFEYVRDHTRWLLRAKEWDTQSRATGLLLTDEEADVAQAWLNHGASLDPRPLPLHGDYVLASQAHHKKMQRRARAQLTAGLIVSLVLTVLAIIMFIFAEQNRREAVTARRTAEINEQRARGLALAANARNLQESGNLPLAIALANNAANAITDPPAEVVRALADAIYAPGVQARLTDYDSPLIGVAFAPEAPQYLTADASGSLRLLDRATSTLVWQVALGQRITALAVSPTGQAAAVGLADNTVQIISTETGETVATLEGHTAEVRGLAFANSGTRLASGGDDRQVRVWDVTDPANAVLLQTLAHPGVVLRVAFAPNGQRIATTTADESIENIPDDIADRRLRLWNVETGEVEHAISPRSGFLRALAYSPNGRTVVIGSLDATGNGSLRFYDTTTGEEVRTIFAHTDVVTNIVFSPNGELVVSTSWDGSLAVWDVRREVRLRQFIGFDDRLLDVDFSPDGDYLLVGTGNTGNNSFVDNSISTSVWLLDLTPNNEQQRYAGPSDGVWSLAVTKDMALVAAGGGVFQRPNETSNIDYSIRVWDHATGEERFRLSGHTDTVDSLDFTPDGTRLLSGSWDGKILLWDMADGQLLRTYEGHAERVTSVAFDPTGARFVSVSTDGTAVLWDTETGEALRTYTVPEADPAANDLTDLALSADGTRLAASSEDSATYVWDVETGSVLLTLTGHQSTVQQVAYSPDGRYLATASDDGTVRLWDAATGTQVHQFVGHTGVVVAVTFSSDSTLLLSGGQDTAVRLWKTETGEQLQTFSGHTDWIQELLFMPDQQAAVSISDDETVRVWRLKTDVESLLAYAAESRYVRELTEAERTSFALPEN